jgi:hypothetical protein
MKWKGGSRAEVESQAVLKPKSVRFVERRKRF